jgi:hypothetical protein
MSDGSIQYMSRFKGIPLRSVMIRANDQDMSLWELYESIVEGAAHDFDLCLGGACFDMKPTYTIKSREHFTRRIRIKNHI